MTIATLFFWIDYKVRSRVLTGKHLDTATIYYDLERTADPKRLKKLLLERNYTAQSGPAKKPGEFSELANNFTVVTREFQNPLGTIEPSRHKSYSLTSASSEAREPAVLEPLVLGPLGAGEIRASSFSEISTIPKQLQKAIIAIEDQHFYDHFGLDLLGILRALFVNLRAGRIVQGGSTLTQQLAKNILLSPERTIGRKIFEILAAISLERHLSKAEIFERYLNEVYLGQEGSIAIHGVSAAARTLFHKEIEQITLSEAALLAGIIRAPSYYAPRKHKDRALKRRNQVLKRMNELDFISAEEYAAALKQPIKVSQQFHYQRKAPFFDAALKARLSEQLNLEAAIPAGVNVYTGIHPELQSCAEKVLPAGLERLERSYPALRRSGKRKLEAGLVALEPHSGLVRAWVGGRDYRRNQFDHVSDAKRPVGSTIKPFLYLTALDGGLNDYRIATADMIIKDEPFEVKLPGNKIWRPENYDKRYHGPVSLRYAFERSLNIPAAYIAQKVGLKALKRTLLGFELSDQIPEVPALALGALDSTLLDLTAAYGALANGGSYIAPRLYISALASDAEVLTTSKINEHKVADENAVFVITNLMQGVIERGTGQSVRKLGFLRPAAGKTGTSNEAKDAWFVGFVPKLVTGVWIGFDDNSTVGLSGGTSAVPIWTEFMKCIDPTLDALDFLPPAGVTFVEIDFESHQRATANCPKDHKITEVFVRGTEPKQFCKLHGTDQVYPSDEAQQAKPRRSRSMWDSLFGN